VSTLVLDIEAIRDLRVWSPPEDSPDAFPPPYAWRPICVGCVLLEGDRSAGLVRTVRVGVVEGEDEHSRVDTHEREILRSFSEFVAERHPAIVTWNGRRYDLPVLMLRSMRAGLPQPWYYGSRDVRYRYTEDGHCDLADAMSDYGSSPPLSLDGMAKLIGLPGKFGDIDGAGVAEAFAAGRQHDIGSYCMADAVQTAFLWLRWQHLAGRMELESYRRSAEDLLLACRRSGRLDELVERIDREVLLLEKEAA
jgi:DNA polymerase elongation subunit (family B)